MKITLENTDIQPGENTLKVIIETDRDDMNIHELWEDIIKPALRGMGFLESTIEALVVVGVLEEIVAEFESWMRLNNEYTGGKNIADRARAAIRRARGISDE